MPNVMKLGFAMLAWGLLCSTARAQYIPVASYVERGGKSVTVGGLPPTVTKWMQTYPGATVTVCITGTSCASLATIYTSSSGGTKSNPFTADPTTAFFQFWVAPGTYDIRFSGTGISTPWTVAGILIGGNGLGNGSTVIDVAVLTPYTSGIDLYAAKQTALAACTAAPACKLDFSGYAGRTLIMSQSLSFPNGTIVYAPAQIWMEPLNVSVIASPYMHLYGGSIGISSTSGSALTIEKINTTTDYTTILLIPPNASSFEIDHVNFGATTPSIQPSPGPAYAITSTGNSGNTSSVTSGFILTISGASISGTVGQTCSVSSFNGGGSSAVGYVTLAGSGTTGYLNPGAVISFNSAVSSGASIGSGYGSPPTTATLGNGTANCSGSVTTLTLLGTQVVSGTFTECASHACAGRQASVHGTVYSDGAGYQIYDSSSTQLILSSPTGTGETPTNYYPTMFAPYATVDGGWGIENMYTALVTNDLFHELNFASDMGMAWLGSGCNCYNQFYNSTTGGTNSHAGLYLGGNTYSNWFGFLNLGTNDVNLGWTISFGLALFEVGSSGANIFDSLDLESSKYSAFLSGGVAGDKFQNTYFEQDQVNVQSGQSGRVAMPTLFNASQQNTFSCGNGAGFDVNDLTAVAGYVNTYCNKNGELIPTGHESNYGSVSKTTIPQTVDNQPSATCTGTCATSYQYYEVYHDWNAGNCGSGAAIIGCSTPITLNTVTNAVSLSTTNYNTILRAGNSVPRVQCVDILKGDTVHYIAKCVSPFVAFRDDGTYSSSGYTPNTRDMTADQTSTGEIGAVGVYGNQGTACTNTELTLSSGWGTSPTVANAAGTGQTCQWTLTAKATTGANPTITDTLTNPMPSANTVCWMLWVGGTDTQFPIRQTTLSATAPVFTAQGTPTANDTSIIVRTCGP